MLRRFVALVSALSVAVSPLLARAESIHGAFVHGVASGDPTSDSVVIWTRVTPTGRDLPGEIDPDATARFDVAWTVSTAPPTTDADAGIGTRAWDRAAVVQTGAFDAGAETDWCVKVEVRRLTPNLRYHYAFETIPAPGRGPIARSPVGTFTLPPPRGEPYPAPGASSSSGREISSSSSESSSSLKFAVFSCSSWAWGRFHAYDAAWRGWGENLTAWLHLGDYYYEYGPTHYPSADEAVPDRGASLFPRRETVTLDDYRRRHATHRSDPSLQKLSAAAPLLAMWDDHEIANDPWVGGAEDHQEGEPENEGDWEDRKVNALRAYHEWLPTRVGLAPEGAAASGAGFSLENFTLDELRSYERVAHFGDVASVALLETRVGARTETDAQPGGGVFANATRRFAGGGGGGERGGGSTGSAEDASFLAPARWDEDPPGLQSVASEFAAYRDTLDAYAERDGAAIVGEVQLAWLAGEMRASKDAGVAWQVVAQASPTVDGASPDLEKGAAALDAAGETEGLPPPYRTWREALEAWTDWRGESEGDGSGGSDSGGGANAGSEKKVSVGRSGISPVPAASARAALALGKYRVNWNFDDWRGYAKERRRLYESVLPNARRAMVLGGDSHDAWAGTVSADARDWNPARGYSYDSSGRPPRTPTGDESVDRRSGADDRWAAVEFDVPGVTPPGAHERAFPWLPFELSDAGHLAANAPTMTFAKSGRRGFALVTFETGASNKRATATFVATPEVREETYAAKCLGAFEAAADDQGGPGGDASGSVRPLPLRLREIACPPLPAALPRGDDANLGGAARASGDRGSSSSELASVAVICAVVGGVFGFNWPFGRGGGGGGGGGGGDASGRRRNAGSRTVGGRRYRAFEREDDDPEVELEGAGVVAGYGSAGSDENPENPGSRRRRTAA